MKAHNTSADGTNTHTRQPKRPSLTPPLRGMRHTLPPANRPRCTHSHYTARHCDPINCLHNWSIPPSLTRPTVRRPAYLRRNPLAPHLGETTVNLRCASAASPPRRLQRTGLDRQSMIEKNRTRGWSNRAGSPGALLPRNSMAQPRAPAIATAIVKRVGIFRSADSYEQSAGETDLAGQPTPWNGRPSERTRHDRRQHVCLAYDTDLARITPQTLRLCRPAPERSIRLLNAALPRGSAKEQSNLRRCSSPT